MQGVQLPPTSPSVSVTSSAKCRSKADARGLFTTQQHLWSRQRTNRLSLKPIKAVKKQIFSESRSLGQQCLCTFNAYQCSHDIAKHSSRYGMYMHLAHLVPAALVGLRKCASAYTGSGVIHQHPKLGQRFKQQKPVSCSASAVDQFGRSNDASSNALEGSAVAVLSNAQALYQFSRPHTMLGTFISICSVSLLAMVSLSPAPTHIA